MKASFRRAMQAFLAEFKNTEEQILEKGKLCIVMGNESCDLDSAVSSLTLAFYYQVLQSQIQCSVTKACLKTRNYLPVLNVAKDDFAMKTEVDFAFNKYGINSNVLTFIDEVDPEDLEKSDFILVDHHDSPFINRCLEVFDHRPVNQNVKFPENCKVTIETVGSCATLIAEMILKTSETNEYVRGVCGFATLSLLRNAIILDTVNFNTNAQRYQPKDLEVCDALEKAIERISDRPMEARKHIFDELVEARSDVDSLTPLQILRKDMKIISHPESGTMIASCALPISLKTFSEIEDAESAMEELAEHYDFSVIILVSLNIIESDEQNIVEREVGIFNVKARDLTEALIEEFTRSKKPHLDLEKNHDIKFFNGTVYRQKNLLVTRKHILPMVQKVINEFLHEGSVPHEAEEG